MGLSPQLRLSQTEARAVGPPKPCHGQGLAGLLRAGLGQLWALSPSPHITNCGPFSGFAEENSDDLYGLFETSSEDNHPPVGQMAPVAPDMLVVEPHQNFEQEHTPSTITVPQHTQPTYTYDPDAPLQVLHDVYGFIPPLAMDPQHPAQAVPEVTTSSRKLVSLLVGVDEGRLTDLLKSYSGRLAAKFALNLADSNTTPGADVFDLIAGNYRPLASSARLKTLTKIDDDLFVFNFEGDLHKWRLAVTNIVDALLVCRLTSWHISF